MSLTLGFLQERGSDGSGDKRVSIVPKVAAELVEDGYIINVQLGAGTSAGFFDKTYEEAGCNILGKDDVICKSDVIVAIKPPEMDFAKMAGKVIICWVVYHTERGKSIIKAATEKKVTLLDITALPKISLGRKMDVLQSQLKIAGYRAVIEAAYVFGRFHMADRTPMGDSPPCQTFVAGCGVAGLAAIAQSKTLGSVVKAWDAKDVPDPVESLGAEWVKDEEGGVPWSPNWIARCRDTFSRILKHTDIAITAHATSGTEARLLITKEHVEAMAPGSVIVDLAAMYGCTNCELTKLDEAYTTKNGVTIIGYSDLPSRMATQASLLYAQNIKYLIQYIHGDEKAAGFLANMQRHLASKKTHVETTILFQISADNENLFLLSLAGKEIYRFALDAMPTPMTVADLQRMIMDRNELFETVTVFAGSKELAPADSILISVIASSLTAKCVKRVSTCIVRNIVRCVDGNEYMSQYIPGDEQLVERSLPIRCLF